MPWQRSEGRKCGSTILLLVSQQMMNVAAIWNSVVGVHSSSQYRGCSRGSVVNVSSSPRVQTVNFSLRSFLRRQCSADLQLLQTYIKLMPCFSEDPVCFRVRIAADFLPAPCANQKQSSPPGSATSCHPSIHREVVRITDPGSSSPFCSQSHDARPGNPHRPRWRRHPLEHPPPALPPHPSRPRHPASLYDLEGAPLALDLFQNPSGPALGQRETVRATPDPPLSDLHAAKRSARAKKKSHMLADSAVWCPGRLRFGSLLFHICRTAPAAPSVWFSVFL